METPQQYYTTTKTTAEKEKISLESKANQIAIIRGLLFLVTAILTYKFIGHLSKLWPLLVVMIGVFLWLVKKNLALKNKIAFQKNLIEINQTELEVAEGDFSKIYNGREYLLADHPYCHDIDLFDNGSFFQFINRTTTKEGEIRLAGTLNSNDISNIEQKQLEIKESSGKIKFRQAFAAHSMMIESDQDYRKMLAWFDDQDTKSIRFIKYIVLLFSCLSVGLITMAYLNFVPDNYVLYWFLFGLALISIKLKSSNKMANQAAKYEDTIRQYAQLIHHVEQEEFSSKNLQRVQNNIRTENHSASEILMKLGRIINALENRNSPLISAILNGFFLYDYFWIDQLKNWINDYRVNIEKWFDTVYHIDAINSLAGYAYNHPQYVYPVISTDNTIIKAQGLGHPQIPIDKRVNNDFVIDDEQFIIITGANMAGKSTFLRTIALHIVLANIGLPAAAKEFIYSPIKLISSMRTTDSLKDQESYFFSELKRLKYIIDLIQKEKHFIILDEILKGTNSKDKEEGSKKFVKKLISTNATGIIATHDLSLCTLSEEHSEVQNKYFDAQIIDDELYFDYTFKDGVCQNMNASFLLKKMDIV